MKHTNRPGTFDPSARIVPRDWLPRGSDGGGAHRQIERDGARRWMTTLTAPLSEARDCALGVLEGLGAKLAYLYEAEDKVVIRCLLPERQVRTEIAPLADGSGAMRIIVVTTRGAEVDRQTSATIVEAIERALGGVRPGS